MGTVSAPEHSSAPSSPGDGSPRPPLTKDQRFRALGCLIGAATGDALGAPYEFEPPIAASDDVAMIGGGHFDWEPGEWTDDTAMSIVVLQVAAEPGLGECITSESSLDAIAAGWSRWSRETVDIGLLTSDVMTEAHELAVTHGRKVPSGADMLESARTVQKRRPGSAGNGGLMRCYSAVLPMLRATDDELIHAITTINCMTHADAETIEAALLWSFALRHAIMTGEIDVRIGLAALTEDRRREWEGFIEEAESAPPSYFKRNGWVRHAFQAAVSSIAQAGEVPSDKFERRTYFTRIVEGSVRAGYDTDTVASIAGALAGAALGYKAVDPAWRRVLHGWPGHDVKELIALGNTVLDRADAR